MADGDRTDEKLESAVPKKMDMDTRFFAGCITIAVGSLVFYALLVWPFFAFPVHLRSGLVQLGLFGALPAFALGVLSVRKLGLEGATAFIGGSLAGSVNAYLRIDSLMLGKLEATPNLPAPDYPESWAWLLPLAWALLAVATALILLPRHETGVESRGPDDRQ
jgi:hypothetical protein